MSIIYEYQTMPTKGSRFSQISSASNPIISHCLFNLLKYDKLSFGVHFQKAMQSHKIFPNNYSIDYEAKTLINNIYKDYEASLKV